MNRWEMEKIWEIDGMCYRIRARWVSADTARLNGLYLAARKRADRQMTTRYARQLADSQARDIAAALDLIRAGDA